MFSFGKRWKKIVGRSLKLMCISKDANSITYPWEICYININNDSAAHCDIVIPGCI